ncbi:ferredoxin-type protein NapF [Aliivibrio fischeri]|uniref:Ferredoxin-type protein NapF n=3 Tax=Aliivibrio fischeri TaxID=668 RepID=Q5E3J4_ALIF1|nr:MULTISPECIES: ferredoxin-type protein NapF [Aliivibrio]AAW86402.1 ferredoxin-type protein, predicted role in electron transfer to periplasmic nitrate reductase (NapA) [Aliivibrio fischeri ES114]EHN70352.1 ferredoxin-type protein, role in electron transfer to periplasmic nitrate reductase (NapA) [Aliivibrio fischeri SR5]KLU79309.1 ferredoxin [Aliivibrio fischeri]MBD1569091.1 ferredoxin-type protein NapF [Aliivibrio sp. S10_S31]MBP3142570.1 ferredoxin-type protein NapF [Aliivibrio fischeri]
MSQDNAIDHSKRGFFRRLSSQKKINPLTQQRLPWVENESVFTSKCTRCEKCINACEENIIVKGDGGFPIVDFTKGECTFCEGCANSCPEALFDLTAEPVFSHKISINENCLAKKSVECRSCSDMCETQAIRFQLQLGSVAQPKINFDACNGCGGCVAVCPTSAISMTLEDSTSC